MILKCKACTTIIRKRLTCMMVNGMKERCKAKDNSRMLQADSTKETFKMVSDMDTASIAIRMEMCTLVTGWTTSKKEKASSLIRALLRKRRVMSIKASSRTANSTDSDTIFTPNLARTTLASGKTINGLVKVNSSIRITMLSRQACGTTIRSHKKSQLTLWFSLKISST